MSRWELDIPTIKGVIRTTESDRDELSRAIRDKDLAAIEDGLAWGGPIMEPLQSAVLALLQTQGDDILTIRNHVAAGLLGLTNATLAYQAGNEDMLAELQHQMLESADRGDFAYWMRHGMTS